MGSTAEWGRQRKDSVSLKTEWQKLPKMNNRRKIDCGAGVGRASRTYRTLTEALTFMPLRSQKEKRKMAGLIKVLKEIMAKNSPNLAEDLFIYPRDWVKTKQDKPKEIYVKIYHSQTKTHGKQKWRKNLEANQRETAHYLPRKNNLNDSNFLIKNHGGQKEVVHVFMWKKKKELSTKNSIFSEKILQI